MKKTIFCVFVILALTFTACQPETETSSGLLSLVPPKTAMIFKTENLPDFVKKLEANSFIKNNPNLPVQKFLESAYRPLSKLQLSGKSLVCFTKVGRDDIGTTLITKTNPKLLNSVGYEKIKGFMYNGQQIKEYKIAQKTIYGAKLNGLFVFGDSKLVVENMVRLSKDNLPPDSGLQKIYKTASNRNASGFINPSEFQKIYSGLTPNRSSAFLKDFTNWTALDLDVKTNGFQVNGVSIPDRDQKLGLFNGTHPQKNEIAKITPVNATGFYSFTYSDFDKLKDNLSFYRKEDYPKIKTDLFASVTEIGEIYTQDLTTVVLNSTDPAETQKTLAPNRKLSEEYRGVKIYGFSKPGYFYSALQPLVNTKQIHYYTLIGNFFAFARRQAALENIIANSQSKTVLAETKSYRQTAEKLSDESSILVVGISENVVKHLAESVPHSQKDAYLKTTLSNYNFSALQFTANDDYTYVNGVFQESTADKSPHGGVQLESIKPGEDLASAPWFFENWRNHHEDIVLQGKSNTLYVYNAKGKLRWKKQLDGRILGDIQPIDIYQNRRIQMAFVTPHTFYIIDRDGNVVNPFNKKFDKPITQPLALFDYSHNGRFRFLITQDKRLTMFDKNLKKVKGFTFNKTKTPVIQAPKHFRIGRKDYIVIPEKSGKLHILNPRGQTRVKVERSIDFSDNEWFLYHDHFTSTTANGNLVEIDQSGKLKKTNLKLGENNSMAATAKTLVTFSENTLTIKGKSTTLDYGLYTAPEIFYIKDKLYISITDTQAHKVYLFDSSSNLFPGFPVYGNSTITLQNMDNRGSLELLVQGQDNSVLVYQVR